MLQLEVLLELAFQLQPATTSNLFLVPTLFFGKKDRIVLTGGIMGGQQTKLAKGYQIGDILEGEGDIPTTRTYRLGGFVGISFNLTAG